MIYKHHEVGLVLFTFFEMFLSRNRCGNGNLHGAYGVEKSEDTTFVNAAILSENYELMYEPILLRI